MIRLVNTYYQACSFEHGLQVLLEASVNTAGYDAIIQDRNLKGGDRKPTRQHRGSEGPRKRYKHAEAEAERVDLAPSELGLPEPVGLQYSYSLIDRGVELDVLPAGQAIGMGLVAWSPLGAGMLTGKYGRDKVREAGPAGSLPNRAGEAQEGGSDGRLNADNPYAGMLFTESNFTIVGALREVAAEVGRPMAQVALAWVVQRPGVPSVLVGASRPEQLVENIASLDVALSVEQQRRLDAAGAPPLLNPYLG